MKNRMLALALAVMLMVCAVGGAADETASPETTAWEETSGESGDTVPETPVSGGETGQEGSGDAAVGGTGEGGTETVFSGGDDGQTGETGSAAPEQPGGSAGESVTETGTATTTETPEEQTAETWEEPTTVTTEEPTTETPEEPTTETTEESTVETTEEPTTETTEEPTAETPEETTEETTEEPTAETPEGTTEETTEEPTAETPEGTTEGTTEETTEEPVTEGTPEPEGEAEEWRPAADDEAWMENPEGDPPCIGGKLETLLESIRDRSGEYIIYLCSEGVMKAKGFDMDADLAGVIFDVDPVIFRDREMTIYLSNVDPGGGSAGDEITLYVWVEEKKNEPVSEPTSVPTAEPTPEPTPEPESEPTAEPTPEPESEPTAEPTPEPESEPTPEPTQEPGMSVAVECGTFQPDTWVSEAHRFRVSGIPEDQEGYYYAAIVYDERIAVLSADTFTAREEGKYSVQFAICDAIGDIQCVSDIYIVQQDYTPPVWFSVTLREDSKTSFDMYAEDDLSGVAYYSFDGGESWIQPGEDGKVTGSGKKGEVFEIGTLLVKDAAGNIAEYPEPFEIPGGGGGGGFGGGGGGGGDKKGFVHSPSGGSGKKGSGGTNIEKKYGSFVQETVEEAVEQLTIDGEPLKISVENPELTEEQAGPRFLAEFTVWGKDETKDEKADTLILTLEKGEDDGEDAHYVWKLNGAAYRLLYKGGVKYLAFIEGDRVCALSTAGFTAGTEYTRLMRLGTSASQFDYAIELAEKDEEEKAEDDPIDWKAKIRMTVQPGEEDGEVLSFELAGESGTPMYYYDVHCGSKEIFDTPFEREDEDQ